jgi:hypothetical protein
MPGGYSRLPDKSDVREKRRTAMSRWKLKEPEFICEDDFLEKWLGYFWTYRDEPSGIAIYEYEDMAKGIARYWLDHREHGPDYGNLSIRYIQQLWNVFIELFEPVEENQ